MPREEVLSYLGGCFNGEPASCSFACPFNVPLRDFIKKTAKKRIDSAYKELQNVISFPALACYLCPAPCEKHCQISTVVGGEALNIRKLELSVIALAKKTGQSFGIEPKKEKIAIIGAGPAGLSCALMLARKKYPVTVFERNDIILSSLRDNPMYDAFAEDVRLQFAPLSAEFVFGREIISLSELEGFTCILVSSGKDGNDFGLSPSRDSLLSQTSIPGVFICGEVSGESITEGMASAMTASNSMEAYIQTGSPEYAREKRDRLNACRYVPHKAALPSSAVSSEEELYSKTEAAAEAERCFQCDCSECMNYCELLPKYNKKPPRIASDVIQDGLSRNSVSTASITRQTWSCNLCGACTIGCPGGSDIEAIFQDSRQGRVKSGNYPPALHAYWLREFAEASGEDSYYPEGDCDYLFFPGCRLGAGNPEYVIKSYEFLRDCGMNVKASLDCCGAPVYWAGEEEKLNNHIEKLREKWKSLNEPTVITACASCRKMLRKFLPEMKTISLYGILAEKLPAASAAKKEYSVFDPCAASFFPEMKDEVRALSEKAGITVSDFSSGGKCCGFGGHMSLANPELYNELRASRSNASEKPYLVYCANCLDTFRSGGKEAVHILGEVFGIDYERTTLSDKRRNRKLLRREIMKLDGISEDNPTDMNITDDIKLVIPIDVSEKAEALLIPGEDIKSAIISAENSGEGLVNSEGEVLCTKSFGAVTVWVKYRRTDGGFEVLSVYSHRMSVKED
ncbi:MAG: FAD-dependent oxidoreductase [Oscillospiraceae bacterium]|nr:FAD-dependent oxidoreductase [Oscillospiraceae bacterium]